MRWLFCLAVLWLSEVGQSCAYVVGRVEFGIPFTTEDFALNEDAITQFFNSEALARTIRERADYFRVPAPTSFEDPQRLMNRIFLYLPHREVAYLIVRYGLLTGWEGRQSIGSLALTTGLDASVLRGFELTALQSVIAALLICGREASWQKVDSIKRLRLSVETTRILLKANFISIISLRDVSDMELRQLRRFGPGRVREVRRALEELS